MGRLFSYWTTLLLLTLWLGGCGELTPPGERSGGANSYTVRPGDTLYSIAWGAGLDAREVAEWNGISAPYTIYPGQQLSMVEPQRARPASSPKVSSSPARTASSSQSAKSPPPTSPRKSVPKAASTRGSLVKPRRSDAKRPTPVIQKAPTVSLPKVEKPELAPNKVGMGWRWPTDGKLVGRFDVAAGKKGVDIGGRSGQAILTAAAGDVVYSGSGLLGYGNLVIIKHDDIYLSAYGHNSQLLVKEGDRVSTGQKIAEMGVSPKEGAILHFEIRKDGKPVDPLVYLPKRN